MCQVDKRFHLLSQHDSLYEEVILTLPARYDKFGQTIYSKTKIEDSDGSGDHAEQEEYPPEVSANLMKFLSTKPVRSLNASQRRIE